MLLIQNTVQTATADAFPFIGPVPKRDGHFIAAGFAGHGMSLGFTPETWARANRQTGMPRILLSTAHIAPLVLDSLGVAYSQPQLAATYPPLPHPFHCTPERIEKLQDTDVTAIYETYKKSCEDSARKPFCNITTLQAKF